MARSAGVPEAVVERAREALAADGAGSDGDATAADDTSTGGDATAAVGDGGNEVPPALRRSLRQVDVATTTPLEALELLAELKEQVE